MSTDTRTDLAQYAQGLAEQRDKYIAEAKRARTAGSVEFNVGFAAGMRLALAYLHIATGGEYGARRSDQPDPFIVPIAGGEGR